MQLTKRAFFGITFLIDTVWGNLVGIGGCACPCIRSRDSLCQYLDSNCYHPICPPGTFLCCVGCRFSICILNAALKLSDRGVRECIVCPVGFYCDGCDVPKSCPEGTVSSTQGNTGVSDCKPCGPGLVSSSDRTRCCSSNEACESSDLFLFLSELDLTTFSGLPPQNIPVANFLLVLLVILN